MNSKDILLGLIGIGLSFYGSARDNLLTLLGGALIITLTIYLNLQEQENDIKILKAQINTHMELKKIWREIDELKQKR